MSFSFAHYFSQKYGGYKALKRFIELCNTPHIKDRHIAQEFGVSRSQVVRWRKALLVCQWVPSPGTAQFLQFLDNVSGWESEERAEYIKMARSSPLRLITRENSNR